METQLDEQIKKRLAELPTDIRQAIESVDLGEKIRVLGTRHGLHIDQLAALEDEIMLVMLGFADPSEFTERLEQVLGLLPEKAAEVTGEVVEEFFLPIRESMKHFMAAQTAGHTLTASTEKPALMPATEATLTEKTITPAPDSATPRNYAKDPYREPIE